jgi:hypothetical protein
VSIVPYVVSRWWAKTEHLKLTDAGILYQLVPAADPDADEDELVRLGRIDESSTSWRVPEALFREYLYLCAEYRESRGRDEVRAEWRASYRAACGPWR